MAMEHVCKNCGHRYQWQWVFRDKCPKCGIAPEPKYTSTLITVFWVCAGLIFAAMLLLASGFFPRHH
jgi:hypothetical protein